MIEIDKNSKDRLAGCKDLGGFKGCSSLIIQFLNGAPSRQDLRVVVRPRNQDAGPSEQF